MQPNLNFIIIIFNYLFQSELRAIFRRLVVHFHGIYNAQIYIWYQN